MALSLSVEDILTATRATLQQAGARTQFHGVTTDSRSVPSGSVFVALVGEKFDGHDFVQQVADQGGAAVIVQRGRKHTLQSATIAVFEVDNTLTALGQLALFHRQRFRIPIGAVTGSNGKTTTKELIGSILATRGPIVKTQGNLNNEIGVPLTLFGLEPSHVAAIVEMGMNHEGEIDRLARMTRPQAGLITIVQPAHLEGVGSIEGVARAKTELFRALDKDAVAIINLDDERIVAHSRGLSCRTLTFGRHEKADVRLLQAELEGRTGTALRVSAQGRDVSFRISLVGAHNAMNATGAFAMGLTLGYSVEQCVEGLQSAQAHARRLQIKPAPHGVTVVDDCYNANPSSMMAAIDTLGTLAPAGHRIAVVGDMLELGSDEMQAHRGIGTFALGKVDTIAFFGARMKAGFEAATSREAGSTGVAGRNMAHFDSVEALVTWLKPKLKAGDYVLVKASRGMKLERVVDALLGNAPSAGSGH